MNAYSPSHPALLTSQRSPYAPAAMAAYALGATLWTPMLVLVAKLLSGVFAWVLPAEALGLATAGSGRMFAVMWVLRFVLYALGARGGWDYGYGINGVIVNWRLTLVEKVRRLARDWFGVVLMLSWLWFVATSAATIG